MAIITLTEIRSVKPLSLNNQNDVDRRYTSLLDDSEFHDVRPLLGTKLYQDLLRNQLVVPYPALLNEGEYTYENFTYTNPGLRRVLIEFAYARILFFGSETISAFGMGVKQYDDTQSTDRDRAKELYKAAQGVALEYWIEVRNFLNRHNDTYEFWDDCDNIQRNNITPTLRHVSKNDTYYYNRHKNKYC